MMYTQGKKKRFKSLEITCWCSGVESQYPCKFTHEKSVRKQLFCFAPSYVLHNMQHFFISLNGLIF